MECPNCGTENRHGAKFCVRCGHALALACPSCGTPYQPGDVFCAECGHALQAVAPTEPVPPPRDAPASERRLVSVLFADLVGFTSLSETRDAEEVREILSRYFDSSRRLISLYGGTVEKFIGDAVMAVWGTPTATEDDAERAVRAALDLVTAVSALGDEVGAPQLRARAGVLTGEAAVTIGAEGEGMVAGDLVNTASRIQSIASPGAVYVGDATHRATEQTIAYEDAGSHELEGKIGLYPLWQALRVVSGARGALKSQGLEAPFVGRERELRLIKDLFHGSADDGTAHLISITGIAGIGKSRLAWEFYKYFDGLPQVTYWHRGRCLSYGEGVTYWALADMVRMRCRIAEDEPATSALGKLQAVLSEHVLDDDERRFVEPRVAQLLGIEDGTRYERDDLFAAWRVFFERLAAVYPVVMVFEDMQWADDSLLDFIDYLLEWSRNSPLFVCTLARPELQERRPTWGSGRRNFTSIYLEPLQPAAMEELLSGLVPGLPDEVRAQILERAEGIPLYAVETVRMLLDRGALAQEGSVYRPVAAIDTLEIPETLHALIAARLDGLAPEQRRLLQGAAVLGKTFTKRALATLSGLDDDELDPLLRSLVRKEILALQADPRSPEHGQYSFVQDLIRHVAYETLSKRERRSRHLAAASHLATAFSEEEDEIVEVLASHYLDAYRAVPDAEDADQIRAQAREMLSRAGERAASLAAAREAQRYFEQAAELAADTLTQADLVDRAGRMAMRRGTIPEARALFEQALSAYNAAGLHHPAARISSRVAELDYREGRGTEAVARLEQALETLSSEEPDADVAVVAAQLGRYLGLTGKAEEAAAQLEIALELAEALRLTEVFVEALTSKAVVLLNRNRLEEARIVLEGALGDALAYDFSGTALRALNNLAVAFESTDRYAQATETSDRMLDVARRIGDRVWEKQALAGPVSALVLLGRWEEAFARATEAEGLAGAGVRGLDIHLVEIDCWRGRPTEARSRLNRAAEIRAADDPQAQTGYAVHEAMVLRAEGKPRAALEALEPTLCQSELAVTFLTIKLCLVEALECTFALGDSARLEELLVGIEALRPGERPPMLTAHAARFRALLGTDAATVEAGFRRAAEVFRNHQLVIWLAVTQLEHGEWLAEQRRWEEAELLLTEARETFEPLEATPWLERLERGEAGRAEFVV
jgi:predicted ATPase/class 3 adenylate cyclase